MIASRPDDKNSISVVICGYGKVGVKEGVGKKEMYLKVEKHDPAGSQEYDQAAFQGSGAYEEEAQNGQP